MSRALLQLQQDFEASEGEEEATTLAAEGTLDDDAIVQAGLRAELEGLAAAKEHVISLRRLSDQAPRTCTAHAHAMHMYMHMPWACHAHATHMHWTAHSHAMHIPRTCHAPPPRPNPATAP